MTRVHGGKKVTGKKARRAVEGEKRVRRKKVGMNGKLRRKGGKRLRTQGKGKEKVRRIKYRKGERTEDLLRDERESGKD